MVTVKPVIVGYMRILPGMDDQERDEASALMRDLAAREGFALGEVFVEREWMQVSTQRALVEYCRTHGVRNVVVPSRLHLSLVPAMGLVVQVVLAAKIGGLVWNAQVDRGDAAYASALREPRQP